MQVGEYTLHFGTSRTKLPKSGKHALETLCVLEGPQKVAFGTTRAQLQHYKQMTGRKKALAAALRNMGLSKEQRVAFWQTCLQTIPAFKESNGNH